MGGAASKPRSRESERRGGGGAAGGRALLPPAPLALWPPGGGDPASSELRRREQGPRVALQALRALDLTRGRLGSPRVVRAGAWEEEDEEEDGLPGAPPAPAASHLPSAPPSPQLRPMGSFIPSSALYKYLPSAHRVPTAELCAGGGRGGCGGRNPSRPHPPGTPSPDGRGGLSRTRGIWPRRRKLGEFEGCAEIRGGFPKEATPGPSGRSAPPFYSSHCDPSVPLQLVASLSSHLPFPLPRALSPRLIPPPTFPCPRLASPPSGVPSAVASSQRPSQTSTAQVTSLPQPCTHV